MKNTKSSYFSLKENLNLLLFTFGLALFCHTLYLCYEMFEAVSKALAYSGGDIQLSLGAGFIKVTIWLGIPVIIFGIISLWKVKKHRFWGLTGLALVFLSIVAPFLVFTLFIFGI